MAGARTSHGRITRGISPDTFRTKTVLFVWAQLPRWRDDPHRRERENEDSLNADLCKFLNMRARAEWPMVHFSHEEAQTGRHFADLAANPSTEGFAAEVFSSSIYDSFLVFECKRLPAPEKVREREYLNGGKRKDGDERKARASGGVQRYKLGFHGAKLEVAVMIGYLEAGTAAQWLVTINGWITELARSEPDEDGCVWDISERLGELQARAAERTALSVSLHSRQNAISAFIKLFHLWLEMSRS